MFTLLVRLADGAIQVTELEREPTGRLLAASPRTIPAEALPDEVRRGEQRRTRWVWDDTFRWYPRLRAAGIRIDRCVDLRLGHAILRRSASAAFESPSDESEDAWMVAQAAMADPDALFVVDPESLPDPAAEFTRQRAAVEASGERHQLELLLAAESTGALIAVEMRHAGIPWSAQRHDEILTRALGPRPAPGVRPAELHKELLRLRHAVDEPELNPDSPSELLKALRSAGLPVQSSRRWELERLDHPAIAPLLRYKKLNRLLAANGWNWLDTWVVDGRFRPEYVPAAAATGRWGTSGGGALQLPRSIRAAVVADPGWKLIVADASQLEPRILSALSGDRAMAAAGDGDLYEGIVASGAVATRAEAKVAMLGAMYGATQGDGGRLLPRLTRAFPRAVAFVEEAARAGEGGGVVSTRLGRSSPRPAADRARPPELGRGEIGGDQRAWGRFTRNFVVQGTAAEWALCWLGSLRRMLREAFGTGDDKPQLVFFLHDEVVVHSPASAVDEVVALIQASAAEAGRLLFGGAPVRFPVTVAAVDSYDQAK